MKKTPLLHIPIPRFQPKIVKQKIKRRQKLPNRRTMILISELLKQHPIHEHYQSDG